MSLTMLLFGECLYFISFAVMSCCLPIPSTRLYVCFGSIATHVVDLFISVVEEKMEFKVVGS